MVFTPKAKRHTVYIYKICMQNHIITYIISVEYLHLWMVIYICTHLLRFLVVFPPHPEWGLHILLERCLCLFGNVVKREKEFSKASRRHLRTGASKGITVDLLRFHAPGERLPAVTKALALALITKAFAVTARIHPFYITKAVAVDSNRLSCGFRSFIRREPPHSEQETLKAQPVTISVHLDPAQGRP